MLVFSGDDLPALFDVIITRSKQGWLRHLRVVPGNVLFLCARYSHYCGDREGLSTLLSAAFARIESVISVRR